MLDSITEVATLIVKARIQDYLWIYIFAITRRLELSFTLSAEFAENQSTLTVVWAHVHVIDQIF